MHPRALVLCPVDGCPQPHSAEVFDALNQPATLRFPATALPEPGKPVTLADLDQAVTLDVTESARTVDKLLRDHLETHDVLDLVATIQRLQQDIGQHDSGVRPHAYRDPEMARSIQAALSQFGPERLQWRDGNLAT